MSSTEDNVLKQLIEGCLKGERKSQHKVYELYYGKMMGVCLCYAKSDDEAKDVLQDGFIKVFGNMQNYGWNGSFEGWIRRIIVNTAIDSFRKNKASIVRPDSDYVDNYKEEAEEEIEESELSRISAKDVMAEVQNLSPAYKMVFNMYIVEGFTHKEIAEKLGISEGTSKSNLAKAKRNIKKAFGKTVIS